MPEIQVYLIVLPMVFLASVVDAIGGGGGLISLPSYTLAGLTYDVASGTNKLSAMFGSLAATIRYVKSGKLMRVPALWAAALALPGSYLGTRLAMRIGSERMAAVMLVALPLAAAAVLFKRDTQASPKPMTKWRIAACAAIGLVVGAYDGFFGPGTGTFLALLFSVVGGMDMVTAAGTAKPVNLASNLSSLITRLAAGHVLFSLAIPAMLLSAAGGYLGAKLAVRRGARFVRHMMIFAMLLILARLAIDSLRG
ncbi:MAG: sulfite exporter TauE/SafE family protein [Christensenellales bacterium]